MILSVLTHDPFRVFVVNNLQANSNQISDWKCVDNLANNKKLETIYLEHNPLAKDVQYRTKLKLALPTIRQIDATLCK